MLPSAKDDCNPRRTPHSCFHQGERAAFEVDEFSKVYDDNEAALSRRHPAFRRERRPAIGERSISLLHRGKVELGAGSVFGMFGPR